MAIGLAVIGVLAAFAVAFIVWALWRTTRPDWATSEVRRGTLEFLVVIAPFFGGRIKPPKPLPPAVTTPGDVPAGDVDREAGRLARGEGGDEGHGEPAGTLPRD